MPIPLVVRIVEEPPVLRTVLLPVERIVLVPVLRIVLLPVERTLLVLVLRVFVPVVLTAVLVERVVVELDVLIAALLFPPLARVTVAELLDVRVGEPVTELLDTDVPVVLVVTVLPAR